jgi:uncharacterized membrane protein
MDHKTEQINLILLKIENLMLKQQGFEKEINNLKAEVKALQYGDGFLIPIDERIPEVIQEPISPPTTTTSYSPEPLRAPTSSSSFAANFKKENIEKTDFEKFIGENLISKIGILILIIGVGIGAKLAIDKGLISPLTRIILGYLVGTVLMGVAIRLKKNYENFSAVLLSGSIAILYFITYAAYAYYQLIPQTLTFGMMVIFTGFTVVAAIKYDKPVIAHIGLVGAYAVPFLLSDGSGKFEILFSYIAIINIGILALAFSKYWKSLYYLSFALTWTIFLGWRISLDSSLNHLNISLVFSGIYFLTFYATNLAYKIIKGENFNLSDVTILLLNSFIFYGTGYYVLNLSVTGKDMLGLFTLSNAILHFLICVVIYKRKLADRNLFYFLLALVITFITIAAPVQLNGHWITMFWAVEAGVLYILAKKKNIAIYEKLSFPMVFLAFFSLLQDWANDISFFSYIAKETIVSPFFNVGFLSACIFILSFGLMFLTTRKTKENFTSTYITKILSYTIPSILIIVIYCTFRIEIAAIFENLSQSTKISTSNGKEAYFVYNDDYPRFSTCAGYIFTFLFASALTYLNLKYFKNKTLAAANININIIVVLLFLTHGLLTLSTLREGYLLDKETTTGNYFISGVFNISLRYIVYAFFAVLIMASYQLSKTEIFKAKFKTAFDYLLYLAILWLLSSELLNVLELNGLSNGYKLGLSILWGCYALLLISLGLWKKKKHLRVGAIILFAITLVKLFAYDISSLDTISKTIVFVSLGALLLIISFLYNKYKHLVTTENETKI